MTSEGITKVVTGIAGGLLIVLQGINLGELGQVSEQGQQRAEAIKGIEKSLANQTHLLETMETSLTNQSKILETGSTLLSRDDQSLRNQEKILEALQSRFANPTPNPR